MRLSRLCSLLIALSVLAIPVSSSAASFDSYIAATGAEAAFRNLMEFWAYDQHWMMWEMGNEVSRMTWSQNDFADRLRLSRIKPAAGKQVEEIRVDPISEFNAEIFVRFSLENHQQHKIRTFTFTFPTIIQNGRWCFRLGDFLQLVESQYWY